MAQKQQQKSKQKQDDTGNARKDASDQQAGFSDLEDPLAETIT
ncbi:MAG: hypothetical protein ACI8S6_004184, partial [Myxococcota bacterium]